MQSLTQVAIDLDLEYEFHTYFAGSILVLVIRIYKKCIRQKYGNLLVSFIIFKSKRFQFYSNIKESFVIYLLCTFNSCDCFFVKFLC